MAHLSWVPALLDWYFVSQRSMPWRSAPIPYYVWISEVMLQQTQVDTVIPYFNRFIQRFPSVYALAGADLQEVLKAWEGLGYYSRARNMHKAAQWIVNENAGIIPEEYEDLQKLPGVGPYIAAAITSIAYHNPVPVVDGNVLRVFTRFWGIEEDIRSPKTGKKLFNLLAPIIERTDASSFNQAIMELGALVCSPKNPACDECPLQGQCVAHAKKMTNRLPHKSKKPPVPHYEIGVGVIWQNNKILIARRKTDQMLGGLWEFPGGKQNPGEPIEETVVREIREETGLSVAVLGEYCIVKHAYTHFKITLHAFKCAVLSGTPEPKSADEIRWISLEEMEQYPFPKANKRVLDSIRALESLPLLQQVK